MSFWEETKKTAKGLKEEVTEHYSEKRMKERRKARRPRPVKRTALGKTMKSVGKEVKEVKQAHPFGTSQNIARFGVKVQRRPGTGKRSKKKKKKGKRRKVTTTRKTKRGTVTTTTYY